MSSFLIRGLARYFAASAMESRARRQSTYSAPSGSSSTDNKKLSTGDLASWQTQMRWLLPFVKATGNRIIISNPKSHEQIVIDQDSTELPELTLEWMQKYNKEELLGWIAEEEKKRKQEESERQMQLEAHRIEEARGRARFGSSFTSEEQIIQKKSNSIKSKRDYFIPIICMCTFVLALLGLWLYNSPVFEYKRWDKDREKYVALISEAGNSPTTELITPDGFRFGMTESEFEERKKQIKSFEIDYRTLYDWQFGNVHYTGSEPWGEKFHKGKLYCYNITIHGQGDSSLTEDDVNNIRDYYKASLKNGYSFLNFQELGRRNPTYVFTKGNMVITLRHYYHDELWITCEDRSIYAQKVKDEESRDNDENYLPYKFSSDSSYVTFCPRGNTSFKMIKVEGGVFTMGNNEEQNARPEHEVELSSFYIAETEITIQLWEELMGTSDVSNRGRNFSPLKPQRMTWNETQEFIDALNNLTGQRFRLPTEAEWEYAARGGDKSVGYQYSGGNNLDRVAWYGRKAFIDGANSYHYGTNPVGTRSSNELGLYDMSGNVWEWCQDWYEDYKRGKQKNPQGPATGRAKVVRGGCYKNHEKLCTVTYRKFLWPDEKDIVGMRLALSEVNE